MANGNRGSVSSCRGVGPELEYPSCVVIQFRLVGELPDVDLLYAVLDGLGG